MSDETMIERVARAMFEAGWPSEESRALAVKNNPNVIDGYRKLARAAIEEMREPTETMLSAFNAACDDNGHCLAKTGYRAMIDAALSESSN